MNLPYRTSVRLVNNPQSLVDSACHGSLTLKAKPLPIGRHPRGRLWAVAVFFAPIFVFAVELGGRHLKGRASNTSVFNKGCCYLFFLPNFFGGAPDPKGNLEVATLLDAPKAFEPPFDN